jgi:membrane protein DedA with SNARE-associated domain
MTEHAIMQCIATYGYLGFFVLLVLGIVGLPIPDEWLLVICGYLAFHDVLSFYPTVAIAAMGSVAGLTASFMLGRSSRGFFLRRYGTLLSIDDRKVARAQQWFERWGRWVLIVGPFIPGLRNLLGYVAGASGLRLRVFARFAYLGGLFSSVTFVTFGYVVGTHISWNRSYFAFFALVLLGGPIAVTVFGFMSRLAPNVVRKTPTATPKVALNIPATLDR